jgi:ferredoxin
MAKKRQVAFIDDTCTGCAGTPVCRTYCPTEGALEYIADDSSFHFKRMKVNTEKCIGCRSCVTRGYLGAYTEGCPWNAITIIECVPRLDGFGDSPESTA